PPSAPTSGLSSVLPQSAAAPLALHSFPTRRSSDLGTVPGNHVVMVGAASKGIIQRDFQHNATVYKSAYAKNPFDNVTEEELAERSEEHTSELQSRFDLVCRLLLEKKKRIHGRHIHR